MPLSLQPGEARATGHHAEALAELRERFGADRDAIDAQIPGLAGARKIRRITTDLGDAHHRGRTTSRLTLENGSTLFYKARDCAVESAFHDFDAFIGQLVGARSPRKRPAFVLRRTHGWIEAISARSPRTLANAAAASRRAGELLVLLDMLQAIDCSASNIISTFDTVVPVDLETILQPLLAWNRGIVPDPEDPATVLRVGLLPGVDGSGAPTHGAGAWLRDDDFCSGFETGYRALLDHREEITNSEPFTRMRESTVRVLVRPTAAYPAIARAQSAPAGDAAPPAIHATELRALARGDIPRFVTVAPGSHQLAEGDEIVDDCIIEDGWPRAGRWLDNASTHDCAERLALIRAALTLARLRRLDSKKSRIPPDAGARA